MARLNKTQIYAISWLNHQGYSNEKIASELGLNTEQVVKALEKATKASSKKSVSVKTQPVNIINKTAGKGIGGVAIMTKEGSESGDRSYKNSASNLINKAIFRPKNNG